MPCSLLACYTPIHKWTRSTVYTALHNTLTPCSILQCLNACIVPQTHLYCAQKQALNASRFKMHFKSWTGPDFGLLTNYIVRLLTNCKSSKAQDKAQLSKAQLSKTQGIEGGKSESERRRSRCACVSEQVFSGMKIIYFPVWK